METGIAAPGAPPAFSDGVRRTGGTSEDEDRIRQGSGDA